MTPEDAVIGIQTPLLTLHLVGKGQPHASLSVAGYRAAAWVGSEQEAIPHLKTV